MKRNAIVIFKGQLITKSKEVYITKSEELEIIPKDFEGDIVVLGDLSGYSINVKGNLWVMGKVFAHNIIVDGSFYCYDRVDANYITIKEDCVIYNTYLDSIYSVPGACPSIDVKNLNVGGNIECNGNIDAADISTEGDLYAASISANNVATGGDFTCIGDCTADVKVCGFFECKGEFTGDIVS